MKNLNMWEVILISLLWLVCVGSSFAVDEIPPWVKKAKKSTQLPTPGICKELNAPMAITMGQAVLANVTPEQAEQLALSRARIRAAEKICGIRVQESSMVRNAAFAGSYLASQSDGYVIDEEVLGWFDFHYEQSHSEPPVRGIKVMLRTCVSCQNQGRDPSFIIRTDLNRSLFVSGDLAELSFLANQNCYLYIFNLMADNRVRFLLPSPLKLKNHIKKGEKYHFPPDYSELEMRTLPGHPADHEAFLILVTKNQVDFSLLFLERVDVALTDFLKALVSIPISDRKEEILLYEVRNE